MLRFSLRPSSSASGASRSAIADDCNRNGIPDDLDVLPVNFGFARGESLLTERDFTTLGAADLDGDGLLDLATWRSSLLEVHLQSRGGFEPALEVINSSEVKERRG